MWWYLAAVSLLAFAMSAYDKWAARHRPRNRIPEKTLLALAGIGGSVAMLLTMLVIHHKTRHAKFMVGLPLMMIAQIVLIFLVLKAVF